MRMTDQVRTISLGAAVVAILNAGDALFDLADELNVPASERETAGAGVFVGTAPYPMQGAHIALPSASVLVDACDYERCFPVGSPHRPEGYTPLSLRELLAALGVRPEDVTHVVLTHAHFDHFSGVTMERDGANGPAFPNARYYLGRGDWEDAETQAALRNPISLESRTLGPLMALGRLELTEGDNEVVPGLRILAAPGESPGHQLVRVESAGRVFYCLGDLYHTAIEVERPEWMATWADAPATLASRHALSEAALAEDALLMRRTSPAWGGWSAQRQASGGQRSDTGVMRTGRKSSGATRARVAPSAGDTLLDRYVGLLLDQHDTAESQAGRSNGGGAGRQRQRSGVRANSVSEMRQRR